MQFLEQVFREGQTNTVRLVGYFRPGGLNSLGQVLFWVMPLNRHVKCVRWRTVFSFAVFLWKIRPICDYHAQFESQYSFHVITVFLSCYGMRTSNVWPHIKAHMSRLEVTGLPMYCGIFATLTFNILLVLPPQCWPRYTAANSRGWCKDTFTTKAISAAAKPLWPYSSCATELSRMP